MANSWNSIKRGMHVTVTARGVNGVWITLDRHPDRGCWWLHRWNGEVWETTHAHYTALRHVPSPVLA